MKDGGGKVKGDGTWRVRPGAARHPSLSSFIFVVLFSLTLCWMPRLAHAQGFNSDEEIVYIDPAGVIRVFDPVQAEGNRRVEWFSPSGAWTDLALGDFTGDGAAEIVAVGHEGQGGKLAIFDPVYVGVNPVPGQRINDIAWVTHFETTFPTTPSFVATGRFEGGDELAQLVVSRPLLPEERTNPNHRHRLQIWRASGTPPNPSAWNVITTFDSIYEWGWIAAGDFTANGFDELALIDRQRGHLGVFRLTANRVLEQFYANEGAERPWRTVAFGQYAISVGAEMIAARESGSLNNLWAFRWVNNQVSDHYSGFFLPPPSYAFLADIGGNGDVEIVGLRAVPPDMSNRSRLFVRDNNNDPIALREHPLESDNGFLAGAGGDLNGDGRDAIVVIRHDRIRIFYEPYRNRDYTDYPLPTDQRTVHSGNLDATGQRPIPRLGVSPQSLSLTLVQGQVESGLRLSLVNMDTDESVRFSAFTEAAQPWISVSPSLGQTPSTLQVEVDARTLNPGTHNSEIQITLLDAGATGSVEINVTLTVVAGIWVSPEIAQVYYRPCTEEAEPAEVTFEVGGIAGTNYQIELFPQAPWIALQTATGTTPGQFTVEVAPGLLPDASTAEASFVIQAVGRTEPAFTTEAILQLICHDDSLFLPVVNR